MSHQLMAKRSNTMVRTSVGVIAPAILACFWIAPSLVARQSTKPASTDPAAPVESKRTNSNLWVVGGSVVSGATGEPVSNALVRASTTFDLRGVKETLPWIYDVRTDAAGRFRLHVPLSDTVSFDVFAPGFQEAAGPWCAGPRYSKIPFSVAEKGDLQIKLQPALYVAGTVVDELKRPVAGVSLESTMREARGSSYLEFATTDDQGRFALFDFPSAPFDFAGGTNAQGRVTFEHPNMLRTIVRNVYAMTEAQRTNLRITLLSGHEISGTVTSAAGEPVPGLAVDAVPVVESGARKRATTDDHGRFHLPGLQGDVVVTVHSLQLKQKAQQRLTVSAENVKLDLHLTPILYSSPIKTYKILGMTVADVTPELQRAYDLSSPVGVLILDPGRNHFRLGIGTLTEGDSFWIVGSEAVANLKEMVHQILLVSGIDPPARPNVGCRGQVRVVYQHPLAAGSNTQFLTLNDQDLQDLVALYAELQ